MRYLDKITKLQVEIGNFCNADCLGCVRTGELAKSRIKFDGHFFVEPDAFTNILSSNAGQHIQEIEFCGNIDEPLAHPRFLEILDAIYDQNPNLIISIHTNGSTKTIPFYKELGERICKFNKKSRVRFSIDGHANSVWLYRGLKNYDQIIKHAQTCIDTGAGCVWQMVSFPWNEHESDSCETLAKQMGFLKFVLRRDRSIASKKTVSQIERIRKHGMPERHFNHAQPINDEYINFVEKELWHKYVTWDTEHKGINCHFSSEGMIFIDHKSRVWPCCFLANPEMRSRVHKTESYLKQDELYGKDWNNLTKHTFDDIINGDYFSNDIVDSWSKKTTLKKGCHSMCIKQCSAKSIPIGKHLKETENA